MDRTKRQLIIVERHGGMLEVDNRPGDGATFSVILPVEDGEALRPRA